MPLWLVWVPAWKKRVYYPDLWVLCCDFMWPDSEWDSRVLGESCGPGFSSWAALSWARANAAFSASSCEKPSTWIRPCSHFWKEKKMKSLQLFCLLVVISKETASLSQFWQVKVLRTAEVPTSHTETFPGGTAYCYLEHFLSCWLWHIPHYTLKGSKLTKSAIAGSMLRRTLSLSEVLDATPRGKCMTIVVMHNSFRS